MRKLLDSILLASAVATPVLADPPTTATAKSARRPAKSASSRASSHATIASSRAPSGRSRKCRCASHPSAHRSNADDPAREQCTGGSQSRSRAPTGSDGCARPAHRSAPAGADERDQRIDQRQDRVEARQVRQAARTPVVSNVRVRARSRRCASTIVASSAPRWSTNWKNNNKYDWHGWRKRHRSFSTSASILIRSVGGTSPYSIGWRLWPSYYSSRYWINNPYQYRLPYAPPGYQWVRY